MSTHTVAAVPVEVPVAVPVEVPVEAWALPPVAVTVDRSADIVSQRSIPHLRNKDILPVP